MEMLDAVYGFQPARSGSANYLTEKNFPPDTANESGCAELELEPSKNL